MSTNDNKNPSEEVRFTSNLEGLIESIYELVVDVTKSGYKIVNPEVLKVAGRFISQFDPVRLINGYIRRSNKHWNGILAKDKSFFINNAHEIFAELPMDEVKAFNQLFTLKDKSGNTLVSVDKEEELWDFFYAMCKISIKYIHRKREPITKKTTNGVLYEYESEFFEEIDLLATAKKWNVTLVFPEPH